MQNLDKSAHGSHNLDQVAHLAIEQKISLLTTEAGNMSQTQYIESAKLLENLENKFGRRGLIAAYQDSPVLHSLEQTLRQINSNRARFASNLGDDWTLDTHELEINKAIVLAKLDIAQSFKPVEKSHKEDSGIRENLRNLLVSLGIL